MSKNMTRKGLAFAAISSLVTAAFGVLPASAAGINDGSVSLAPNTGTNYAVLLGQEFTLKANSATAVTGTGKYLKFLVEDASGTVSADQSDANDGAAFGGTAKSALYEVVSTVWAETEASPNVVTVTVSSHKFKTGDKVSYKSSGTTAVITGTVSASSTGTSVVITSDANGDEGAPTTEAGILRLMPNTAAAGKFVYQTRVDTNTSDTKLVLETSSSTTKSATVTAWVDDNNNDLIDATENQSPARVVSFNAITDITPTVTFSPVTTGDTTLSATISTTPALNGQQVGNDKVGAVFTRQDSAKSLAKLATYNVDTGLWEVSVGLGVGVIDTGVVLEYGTATDGNWGFTNPTARSGVDGEDTGDSDPIDSIGVSTAGVVTVTTDAAHNLRTGDKITMVIDADDSAVEIAEETTAVSVTVTGTLTFTYAISETTLPTAALSDTDLQVDTDYTIATYSTNGLVTRAFAGTHTVQFAAIPKADIGNTTAQYLDKVGSAISSAATAKTASSISVDAVEGATAGKTGADATDILNGTKTASVTVTVLTSTGAAAAGKAVKATVNGAPTGSGDFTLNSNVAVSGTAAYATTNAAGQATFTVTNSIAAIGDAIALQFTTEGLTAVSETLTWNDAQYRIVDLNDSSEQSAGIRDRYAVTGGSYTFDLMIMDQFRNAAPAAFGLLAAVTERAVSTSYITPVAGKASLTVTDGGLGVNAYAVVDLQIVKNVAGVWTTPADDDVVNWDQAYSSGSVAASAGEQTKVHVHFATQTDKITLNANGASTPNTATAADLAATVATVALTEADLRLVGSAAPSYAAANKGVVSGSVANSVTGVANKGAVVTATLAGALFKVGNVWKKDSISFLTDTNGFFAVDVYSSSAGSKTVTISSGNATAATAAVVYTGIAGTAALTITAPAAVKPASTFQVKAKLADAAGNVVDTAAGRVKVTYTGPGIIFGTLPTETDANGELSFSVLLGSNDTGSVSVAISYDANADADFIDATDLTASATIAINATGTLTEQKVNAGSFKGYVALYAKGYAGQRMSTKVGKDWVVVESLASNFERVVEFTGAGYTVAVRIYIDRVLIDTITVTTK